MGANPRELVWDRGEMGGGRSLEAWRHCNGAGVNSHGQMHEPVKYAGSVERTVTSRRPSHGGWLTELACGHTYLRPVTGVDRVALTHDVAGSWGVGMTVFCECCERAELPDNVRLVRTSQEWSDETLPPGLLRRHRLAETTWGLLRVLDGRLAFSMACTPPIEIELGAGASQAIPPSIPHQIGLIGPVRCAIDFLEVEESRAAQGTAEQDGRAALSLIHI